MRASGRGEVKESDQWRYLHLSGEFETQRLIFAERDVEPSLDGARLILIESQTLLRESFAYLLETCLPSASVERFESVEDVADGPADLVLIGVDAERDDATAFAEIFWAACDICVRPPIGALVHGYDQTFFRGLAALGVAGIIEHTASAAVALAAVRLMVMGGYCFPPDAFAKLPIAPTSSIALERPPPPLEGPEATTDHVLTSRECDVLRSLREGRPNKLIAHELGISESTVKVHLRNIMKKLNASNRTQVALGAFRLD